MAGKLRLKAENLEDLTILSSLLQDAVCRAGEMAYLPEKRRFALVANRCRWEREAKGKAGAADDSGCLERVRCGVRFENVLAARARKIPRRSKNQVLELLALEGERHQGGFHLHLVFAGGAAVRLEAEVVEAYLEDLTGPWPARARPEHPVAGAP